VTRAKAVAATPSSSGCELYHQVKTRQAERRKALLLAMQTNLGGQLYTPEPFGPAGRCWPDGAQPWRIGGAAYETGPNSFDPYALEGQRHTRAVEREKRLSPYYMEMQADISESMRTILIDWLVEVTRATCPTYP